jgi:hypothetical protein
LRRSRQQNIDDGLIPAWTVFITVVEAGGFHAVDAIADDSASLMTSVGRTQAD